MNIIYVIVTMVLLGVIAIIILNVAIAVQDMYSTVLKATGGSTSAYYSSISPYAFWTVVFTILGFFGILIVLVLYEKNR
ncbi:MAG: hypothetical protein QW430_12135 [Metallosphaera sp.]|uniref:hypothetical protein n=1 Tax=Metallosphaera sp. TaxID=2020860 RepID=UPI00315FB18F